MKVNHLFLMAGIFLSSTVLAAEQADHKAHHPEDAVAATAVGGAKMDMSKMEQHMKAMQTMHQKMMSAKTPEERQALMAEHMKLMQEGMAMMQGMGNMMGGMGAMGGGKPMPGMTDRQQMMEKRMDMMESMMQMMMDRMAAMPAK